MKELLLPKSFGKEICNLVPCRNMKCFNDHIFNLFSNEMAVYFSMFCSFMVHRIDSNIEGCFPISIKESKLSMI